MWTFFRKATQADGQFLQHLKARARLANWADKDSDYSDRHSIGSARPRNSSCRAAYESHDSIDSGTLDMRNSNRATNACRPQCLTLENLTSDLGCVIGTNLPKFDKLTNEVLYCGGLRYSRERGQIDQRKSEIIVHCTIITDRDCKSG